jgi:alpha-mannosidase
MEPTLVYIPHTHWEGAVFQTREAYLSIGLPNILRALRLLEADPDFRFTLDQSCYVAPFLERYPEEAEAFRRFVDEGRLAFVGGTHVMHDGNMPGPESYVRQIQYAKGFFRQALGADVTVGWQLDTFGHHAQVPQLMRLAGFGSIWFFRGVSSWETPSEFLWEALDGTRLPAYWLPEGYAVAYGSPRDLEGFEQFMRGRYESLGRWTGESVRPGPAGADVCEPEEYVAALARQANERAQGTFGIAIGTPADLEKAVPPRDDWPVVRGEMNPIFQGAYSSRIELKQLTREIETLLTDAEALGAILSASGVAGHAEPLWDAWEPMLFNQAHDLMSGVMTDRVYEDTLASYAHSKRLAREALDRRVDAYVSAVGTHAYGIPIVVINTLAWDRTDLVTADIGFSASGVRGVEVRGTDGEVLPSQIVEATRNADGTLLQARVAFVASDVPAMGHAVYHVTPTTEHAATAEAVLLDNGAAIENGRVRAAFDAKGALTGLRWMPDGPELISSPANVIAQEQDRGDLWEPYRPLDGGSRIAMKERHPVAAEAVLSNAVVPESVTVLRGPVYSEVRVAGPLGEGGFSTTVRLMDGMDRMDVRTTVLNNERFVRYRAIFPTTMGEGRRFDEMPFGAIERPDGIEYPAQNWVDWSGSEGGLALLNRGLPGANVADGMMMISLLRSTCIVAYGFGGGYEPGMSSETGFEEGKEIAFDYALVPHDGPCDKAALTRRGQEFNHPLIVRKAGLHEGRLPSRWGFLDALHPSLAVTSLRPAPDGSVILRLYDASGQGAEDVELRLASTISSAAEVDLMDENERPVPITNGAARLGLRPFEVKTVNVRP